MTIYEIDFVGTVGFTANDIKEALQKFMSDEDFDGCRPVKITEKEIVED